MTKNSHKRKEKWKIIIDFQKLTDGGVNAKKVLKTLKHVNDAAHKK